ncbi:MAG TPA: hypothetical protein PL033_17125 [Candidatus Brocadiia bacterium]|nr:hypothetical protein [Candidatus Brocadiia bacterium]
MKTSMLSVVASLACLVFLCQAALAGREAEARSQQAYRAARFKLGRLQLEIDGKKTDFLAAYKEYEALIAEAGKLGQEMDGHRESVEDLKKMQQSNLDRSKKLEEETKEKSAKQKDPREDWILLLEERIKRADEDRRIAEQYMARHHGPTQEEWARTVMRRKTDEIAYLQKKLAEARENKGKKDKSFDEKRGELESDLKESKGELRSKNDELEAESQKVQAKINNAAAKHRKTEDRIETYNAAFESQRARLLEAGMLRVGCDYRIEGDRIEVKGGIWKLLEPGEELFNARCEEEAAKLMMWLKNYQSSRQPDKASVAGKGVIRLFEGSATADRAKRLMEGKE